MTGFRSMGCDVLLPDGAPVDGVWALFDARDRRFSRFHDSSELTHVNASPRGVTMVSEEFASMLSLALDAARATGGLATPAAGGALIAAGYDRDFPRLPLDGVAVEPVRVPSFHAIALRGTALLRTEPVILDLNGVVKGQTVDDALELLPAGWVSAGGDVATTVPLVVGLPGGDTITLERGGLATSSVAKRTWRRGGVAQHHLIDPATGSPSASPWRDVTVAAQSCYVADVAAKAALLLGSEGPSWLDRRRLAGRFVNHAGRVTVSERWREDVPGSQAA
ncbi:MAG: FAD:protein FMN transferase [Gaiellaceae bacterium]